MFLGWSQSAAVLRADGLSCGCLSTLNSSTRLLSNSAACFVELARSTLPLRF